MVGSIVGSIVGAMVGSVECDLDGIALGEDVGGIVVGDNVGDADGVGVTKDNVSADDFMCHLCFICVIRIFSRKQLTNKSKQSLR